MLIICFRKKDATECICFALFSSMIFFSSKYLMSISKIFSEKGKVSDIYVLYKYTDRYTLHHRCELEKK